MSAPSARACVLVLYGSVELPPLRTRNFSSKFRSMHGRREIGGMRMSVTRELTNFVNAVAILYRVVKDVQP